MATTLHRTAPGRERKLIYVNDWVPEETTELVRAACVSRAVSFIEVHAPLFDYNPDLRLERGTLLFRPAVSPAAVRVEQFLYNEGVATLYEPPDSIFFYGSPSQLIVQRAGLATPRGVFCPVADRELLRSYVIRLGGFPIIVKVPGHSCGVGTMRVDSFPSLISLVDLLVARNLLPELHAYVPDAIHWRLTVVGRRVVSAYKNALRPDDFRTRISEDPRDYHSEVGPGLVRFAVRAVEALRVEFGGVDVLEHASGRLYFLEANFPAYFANAQQRGGHDIAGAIIEHLLTKAIGLETIDNPV